MEVQQCPDGSFVSRNSEKNCAFDLCPTSPSSEFFSDIPSSDTELSDAVSFLKEHGIVQGYSDKTYRPEAQINRYDFTKIIVLSRIDQKEIQNCNKEQYSFPDVPDNEWFTPYVCAAKANGIVNGFGDGTFQGDKNVTIYEALKMILEAYGVNFEEGLGGQEWYEKYVNYASQKSLNFGLPLKPDYEITRSDMARLIWRQEGIQWREADQSLSEDARCSGAIPGYCPFLAQCDAPITPLVFESPSLHVSFLYDPLYSVKEEGNSIFLEESDTVRRLGWLNENPNITVFQKQPEETPEEAIWRNIFSSSELSEMKERCQISSKNIASGQTVFNVSAREEWLKSHEFTQEEKDMNMDIGMNVCGNYGSTGGISYFLFNESSNHFLFVNIGQVTPPFDECSLKILSDSNSK